MKIFTEDLYKKYNQNIAIEKKVAEKNSVYQNILIFDSKYFGRVMTLDKVIQITEHDHHGYSEMLTHVPILSHGNIKKVLIIGGGDGAIAAEVLKYKEIEEISICEIDEEVINLSKIYLKKINKGSLNNPRVNIIIKDASKLIENKDFKNYFDLIIADRPDPIGPGKNLFKIKFYENIKNILSERGIAVFQTGVPFFQGKELKITNQYLKNTFKISGTYLTVVPTYIGGYMALTWASKKTDMSKNISINKNLNTEYYTSDIHKASFILPNWIKKILTTN
ncbi:polyamine aminopropyltransferase [Alphaproteobacteria bacterium]|nr:polyamine aminopropyltransferase [Alphaproteobacteria bacterium]